MNQKPKFKAFDNVTNTKTGKMLTIEKPHFITRILEDGTKINVFEGKYECRDSHEQYCEEYEDDLRIISE